jgi:hypothetical protein
MFNFLKEVKYPFTKFYAFCVAIYILCSLNSVVKPIDAATGGWLFFLGTIISCAEDS